MVRHTACIGLGSNLGSSTDILQAAWSALQESPGVETRRLSSPYRSRPLGMDSQHWFINAAGLIYTKLAPLALLHLLQSLEVQFGRRRDPLLPGYQDRTLDLDLLLYDDFRLDSQQLTLPHPRMGERRFVLDPLLEIIDGTVLSPFGEPLPQWVASRRNHLDDQEVERFCWSETTSTVIGPAGEKVS